MPAINAHGEFTPTPENHMTPRPHPSVTSIGSIENEPRNLSSNLSCKHGNYYSNLSFKHGNYYSNLSFKHGNY